MATTQKNVSVTALSVYTRSPAAYEALRSFKLLQLPSIRTLKHYIDGNLEAGGECLKRLEEERKSYLAMIEQVKQDLLDKKGIEIDCNLLRGIKIV